MSKLRVYIPIATFHPLVGGAETQAMLQAQTLRARGHEATIITFRHQRAWLPFETVDGVPVIRVAGALLGNRAQLPRIVKRTLFLLALVVMGWTLWRHRHRYDILHVYQLSALALPTAWVCRLTGKPMLIAVRSTGSTQFGQSQTATSLLAGPLDPAAPWLHIENVPWTNGDLEGLLRLGRPVMRYTRSLLERVGAKIIILSTRMQDYLDKNGFLLPNTERIPNGVDIVRFHPSSETLDDIKAKTIICVAKLRYEKGIDVLLQAWHLVQLQCPEARLILVGNGSTNSIEDRFVRMAEELDIKESIELAGLQKDIPAQLRRAGISVLPSRWEGMPNAILEAMACGLPCVATRVSGSEDIIEHGVNGLLVDIEDYKAMAQALLVLLSDPDLVKKYGQAARVTMETYYSLDHITDTYIEIYENMTGRKQLAAEEYSTI
ncbi:MAG TPA: glycosyltransferase family 4 protein [Ktedonosporobacter sp.]|nr:glycosyltransferase family 4 protein [Ktedonosporobacter sp.]